MADEEMSDAPAAEQTDQSEQTQQAGQTQQERRYANPGETLYGEQPQQGGKPQQEEIDWDSIKGPIDGYWKDILTGEGDFQLEVNGPFYYKYYCTPGLCGQENCQREWVDKSPYAPRGYGGRHYKGEGLGWSRGKPKTIEDFHDKRWGPSEPTRKP